MGELDLNAGLEQLLRRINSYPSHAPAIAYFCTYVPPEVIWACGARPVRIFGLPQSPLQADRLLPRNLCPYVRSCLEALMTPGTIPNPIAGAIFAGSCNAMMQLAEAWPSYVAKGQGFFFYLDLPHKSTVGAREHYAYNLRVLARSLSAFLAQEYGSPRLSEKELDRRLLLAIEEYQKVRQSLAGLYQLRRRQDIHLQPGLVEEVVAAAMSNQPQAFLKAWENSSIPPAMEHASGQHKVRLLYTGSICWPEWLHFLDQNGAEVVYEDSCLGIRPLLLAAGGNEVTACPPSDWEKPTPTAQPDDPWKWLANVYLTKVPCSRMLSSAQRADRLLSAVKEYRGQAVIYHALKFCDFALYDYPYFREKLAQAKVPLLYLESDYTISALGQQATRVEAFMEMLAIDQAGVR